MTTYGHQGGYAFNEDQRDAMREQAQAFFGDLPLPELATDGAWKRAISERLLALEAAGKGACSSRPAEPQPSRVETGWLIERHINGDLRYWDGRYLDDRAFISVADEAVRFARREDGSTVLSWLLGGHGRVAQHIWTDRARKEDQC